MQLGLEIRLLCSSPAAKGIHPEIQSLVASGDMFVVVFARIERDPNKVRNMGNERDAFDTVQGTLGISYILVEAPHLVGRVTNRVNSPIFFHLVYDDNVLQCQRTFLGLQGLA